MSIDTADLIQRGDTLDPAAWHALSRGLYDAWRNMWPEGMAKGLLPSRDHFDPIAVRQLLPHITLFEVQREPPPMRFRLRLVGTMITRHLHADPTGRWLDELGADPQSFEGLTWVAENRGPSWRRGPKRVGPGRDYGSAETLVVPLAADGVTVDRMLVLSVVYDPEGRAVLR
ncbi:hypothetical protein V6B08_08375 [Ferrovibrio sp. MS7]|uniref:hypothetical protein n=1 Tax=Ferrovibrio plantarum TaxID=3119164 RepID=UPI0031368A2C